MIRECHIINLDHATERWKDTSEKFRAIGMEPIRVSAVEGKKLEFPHPDFSYWKYLLGFGRKTNLGEIGCYLSHVKIIRSFLESEREHIFICEDDVCPLPELPELIDKAMRYADSWDLLRLNSFKPTLGVPFIDLGGGYSLNSDTKTSSGTGGMILNRFAGETILKKLLPMRLPYDVALFRDFPVGIREVTVRPSPVVFEEEYFKDSSITIRKRKYPLYHPANLAILTSLPYKGISRIFRLVHRHRTARFRKLHPPVPKD